MPVSDGCRGNFRGSQPESQAPCLCQTDARGNFRGSQPESQAPCLCQTDAGATLEAASQRARRRAHVKKSRLPARSGQGRFFLCALKLLLLHFDLTLFFGLFLLVFSGFKQLFERAFGGAFFCLNDWSGLDLSLIN